ncbi:hypothetical protein B0T22DRAFT_79365 [Podospora appendiculata]|uniref:Extracellular matrix protein n=1 Tax=Podospora appendiculata TaxID=314037 RepID=A0AAE0XK25_9PEZI|nr:hypothetical protein B0T22DRAFT_79365 [Podospora appendiculata]
MKFSLATIVGAFAAVTLAKPMFTNSVFVVQEGTPFTLTWQNATAPVTISLMEATDRNNLKLVEDITPAPIPGTSGSFTWTPSGVPTGAYAFRITDGPDLLTDANYSVAFQYFSKLLSSSSSATATNTGSTSSTITSMASSITSSASNSTTTTSTTKSTSATTTSSKTAATSIVNNNNGERFASPLALLLVTVAAVFFFN